ncbi:type II toxin-antitoxin system RelE/ParE family toxin [Halospina sp. K52047b]|uniref:type II toxin-antitoxin system RelE/ParE family toxin n=1 Tax=Halospina sp. K52047b TaxID=2614160 RepID=UPI00124A55E7|nr:type II toxin-antitoxin system RelE/ParE family toxin [Halospina sp. K52047b]KAA8980817.1 toxin [Halospina sp. K52047b]
MKAVFIELPPFERHRSDYLDDLSFKELQRDLMENPVKGDRIQGTGGLRKLRFKGKGKGRRGGLRIIYYWFVDGQQFWLFTLYSKGEMANLTEDEKKVLKRLLEQEKAQRGGR